MQKPGKVQDKFYLKSLHQEIDLYDRKLIHLNKYDVFASDADRTTAAGKMNRKRELLVLAARRLASEGIAFNDADLPRSFRAVNPEADMIRPTVVAEEQVSPGL